MMFELYINNKTKSFSFLECAITFAKASGLWYYITDGEQIIYTQDDEIIEGLYDS